MSNLKTRRGEILNPQRLQKWNSTQRRREEKKITGEGKKQKRKTTTEPTERGMREGKKLYRERLSICFFPAYSPILLSASPRLCVSALNSFSETVLG
jgi:hypothetical protein